MKFDQISQLVGGLPMSACEFSQWWANDSKVEARAWGAAGCHVDEDGVDFGTPSVRFARGLSGGARAGGRVTG